jgi:hypothetical protein
MDFARYRALARQFVLTRKEEDHDALTQFLDNEFGLFPNPKWIYKKSDKRTWKYLDFDVAKCAKSSIMFIKHWHSNPNFLGDSCV